MVIINFILASKSPRRKEILEKFIPDLKCICSNSNEIFNDDYDIITNIMSISKNKGLEISNIYKDSIIISADTIVIKDNKIYPKPQNANEAKIFLKELSGNIHQVITSFSIINKSNNIIICDYDITEVEFNKLDDDIIESYISTEEYADKAGGYGIQDKGSILVKRINGNYFTVMGLPIEKIFFYLKKYFNINLLRLKDEL